MRRVQLRRLSMVFFASLTALALFSCVALNIVTDIMAIRAAELSRLVEATQHVTRVADLQARIDSWSRVADWMAWGIGTLLVLGNVAVFWGLYHYVLLPLLGLEASMRRFTRGHREARAEPSAGIELAAVADDFNEMADIITGQHEQMLDFLSGATQELRDPVLMMRVALEPFAPGRPFPSEQQTRNRLALVSREMDRLERLLQTYLDSSRVTWRRLDLQMGKTDVGALAQQVVRMYENFSSVHRVTLSVPDEPLFVFTDVDRLNQVIHTLVVNAIERSPRGGVVVVRVDADGGEAVLGVTDHGLDIPEKERAEMFEPLKRLSAGQQRSPGASVALAVARRIVEAQRGRIEVTSRVDEGSTFQVRLPLASPPEPEEKPSNRAAGGVPHAAPAPTESRH